MASYSYEWEAPEEEDVCDWCGDYHGDGLTCREVEAVEDEMAREEEEMERDDAEWDMEWDGPRHRRPAAARRRSREVTRVRLVRVGDRVYYAEDTEKIAAYRLVWELKQVRKEALKRREAAMVLWFKVGLDIHEASAAAAPAPAALPQRRLGEAAPAEPRRVEACEEAW